MAQLKFLEDEPALFELAPSAKQVVATRPVAAPPAKPVAQQAASVPVPAVKAPAPAERGKIEKSATAHRTISEVAEELDVPQHVLRFWETKFTQLRPLKRAGGRRYYRTEDVALIRQIHSLLYTQGYTIKGAQKVLKEKPSQVVHPVDKPVEVKAAARLTPQTMAQATAKDENSYQELRDMLAELKALRALV